LLVIQQAAAGTGDRGGFETADRELQPIDLLLQPGEAAHEARRG